MREVRICGGPRPERRAWRMNKHATARDGMRVRVATLDVPGMSGTGPSGGGLITDILFEIFKRIEMAGFAVEPTFYVPRHSPFHGSLVGRGSGSGSGGNTSWNGIVGELQKGLADIAAVDMTVTPERSRVLAFSVPMYEDRLGIVSTWTSGEDIQPWKIFDNEFTRPLSWEVWLLWLAIGIATIIISVKATRGTWHEGNRVISFFFGSTFVADGRLWVAIMTSSFGVFSILMWRAHSARYTASIVNSRTGMVASVSELGGDPRPFAALAHSSTFSYLGELGSLAAHPVHPVRSYEEAAAGIRNGRYSSFVGETMSAGIILGMPPCDMGMVHTRENIVYLAIPMNRDFAARHAGSRDGANVTFSDLVNDALFLMRKDGYISSAMEAHSLRKSVACRNSASSYQGQSFGSVSTSASAPQGGERKHPLHIKETGFFLVVYATTMCISLAVFAHSNAAYIRRGAGAVAQTLRVSGGGVALCVRMRSRKRRSRADGGVVHDMSYIHDHLLV